MKSFCTVAAVVTLLLGVAWLAAPAAMLSLWDASPDGIAQYVGRRYGVLLLGFTVILWLSRAAAASKARNAILAGGAIVTAMMAILSAVGVLSATIGPGAWIAFAVEALLSAGFFYYLITSGEAPQRATPSARPE